MGMEREHKDCITGKETGWGRKEHLKQFLARNFLKKILKIYNENIVLESKTK